MLVLSPDVATTAASAVSMPARTRYPPPLRGRRRTPPFQHAPSRASASAFSSTVVTSQPSSASCCATAEPTRPHPMTTAFIDERSPRVMRSHRMPFGEGHDEHLARGVAHDVVDGRREEPRLAAPAWRRSEHDQVGARPLGLCDDRVADRACDDRPGDHLDAVVRPDRARLGHGLLGTPANVLGQRPSSGNARGTRTTKIASTRRPALLRERDGRGDHLLADRRRASSARARCGRPLRAGA